MKKENGKRLAEQPRKAKKKRDWPLIILIILAILLALALAGVLIWKSIFVRPELPTRNDPQAGDTDTGGDGQSDEEDIYGEGIRPRGGDGERKSENYWTVLIIGRDTGGGGLTDTLLLASYDVTNQKATVMSIPRDTMVNVPWDVKKINSVYNYYGGGEKGIQHLYKEIAQLVGFEPDFQVVVEWEAVGEIVDAMGGVWFDVPRNMNYDDGYQDLHIHQTAGYRLLTGSDAMQVLRYRHDNNLRYGYADGDLGRIKTQQAFLKAMVEQLLQVKNLTKLNQFSDVFKRNVETDLSMQNIFWFGQQAIFGGLKMDDVNFVTMPNTTKYVYSRTLVRDTNGRQSQQSYVLPNATQLLALINSELSPFTEVFTLSDLDIMSVNADGSIRSSTGYVEDRPAAAAPVLPSAKPDKEQEEDDENTGETEEPGTEGPPENGSGEGGGITVIDPNNPGGAGGENDPNTGTGPGWTTPEDPSGPETDPGTSLPETEPPPDINSGNEADPPVVTEPPVVPEVLTDPGFSIIEPPPAE